MHEYNWLVMPCMGPNTGGRKGGGKKKKKEEEEGGVTGLIPRPLHDDLRSGRGIVLDPSSATR